MSNVGKKWTHREIVMFIRSLPRYEVAALCVWFNNSCDANIPSYASKDEMLDYIEEIEKEDLLEAIQSIYGSKSKKKTATHDEPEDDEYEEDEESDDTEDEDTDDDEYEDED